MKWHETMLEIAKEHVRRDGYLAPVLMLKHKTRMQVVSLKGTEGDKDFQSALVKGIIKMVKPREYLLVQDTYFKEFNTNDEGDRGLAKLVENGVLQVSQLQNHSAITAVHGTGGKEEIIILRYEKLPAGKYQFTEVKMPADVTGKGRFVGLRE